MTRDELVWLAERARTCQVIVEAGCWKGRSTRALADHCPGLVIAVDPWSGTYYADDSSVHRIKTDVLHDFSANLHEHIVSGRVLPLQLPFVHAGPSIRAVIRQPADLVFIDGDHRYDAVRADIDVALALLRPGGILAGHDYGHRDWPGVRRAVDARWSCAARCDSIWWVAV